MSVYRLWYKLNLQSQMATPGQLPLATTRSTVYKKLHRLIQKKAFYKEDLEGIVKCEKVYKLIMVWNWEPKFVPHMNNLPGTQEINKCRNHVRDPTHSFTCSTILAIAEDDKYRAIIRMDHTRLSLYFHFYENIDDEYDSDFADGNGSFMYSYAQIMIKQHDPRLGDQVQMQEHVFQNSSVYSQRQLRASIATPTAQKADRSAWLGLSDKFVPKKMAYMSLFLSFLPDPVLRHYITDEDRLANRLSSFKMNDSNGEDSVFTEWYMENAEYTEIDEQTVAPKTSWVAVLPIGTLTYGSGVRPVILWSPHNPRQATASWAPNIFDFESENGVDIEEEYLVCTTVGMWRPPSPSNYERGMTIIDSQPNAEEDEQDLSGFEGHALVAASITRSIMQYL